MYKIENMPTTIDIGFTGEESFRKVEIDMTAWMLLMPDGTPSIVCIRPGEDADDAYLAETTFVDNILTWTVTLNDLGAVEGAGVMQIWLEKTQDTTLQKRGKSIVVSTYIHGSINDPGDTIPPARTALLNLTAEAESLDADEQPTAEWEHDGYYGDYNLKLGIPSGTTFTPSVDASGNISWTNDGGKTNPTTMNIKGPQGDPAPEELVQPAVNAYLATVITNPDSPPLDRTLSSSSAATPADITGQLKSALDEFIESETDTTLSWNAIATSNYPTGWQVGKRKYSNGEKDGDTSRLTIGALTDFSNYLYKSKCFVVMPFSHGTWVSEYNASDGSYIGYHYIDAGTMYFSEIDKTKKYAFTIDGFSSDAASYNNFTFLDTFVVRLYENKYIPRGNIGTLEYTSLSSCMEQGWYNSTAEYASSILDLPSDYDGGAFTLEVLPKALGVSGPYLMQRITSTSGNTWTRYIRDTGAVYFGWVRNDRFTFCGYIEDMGYTELSKCLSAGWYGARRAYVSSITDLPVGYDNQGFTLEVFVRTLGSSSVSIMQRITSTDGGVWVRIIKADGSSVLYDWKKVSVTTNEQYWKGKKVSWFGDSLSYGNGVSYGSAFPYLVANKLEMTIKNYAIGGSVVAKQAGTYDEIVFSLTDFNSMTKDTTKKYLVLDDPTDSHPYRIYTYTNGEWTPTSSHTAAINGRYPIVDVVTGMDASYSDVIVIAVAYNDFMYHWTPFGDMSSRDKTTFYGALHTLCQYLQTTYTESDIVFVSVENSRCQVSGQSGADWSFTEPDQTNPLGKTLRDYFNAMEEVCRYYSIPVLNLGENLGFAQYTIPATYVQNDGCHWTVDGHKRAASVLIPMFDALRANVT